LNRIDFVTKVDDFGNASQKARNREENHHCMLLKLRMNFGAGDGDRTRDVQLGNFLSNLVVSFVAART
jgi:hypothetical protein